MSLYFFRVQNGRYSGAPDNGVEFTDREAAWVEMTKVCGDLVGGILEAEPDQSCAVMFGARAVALVESAFTDHLVSAWKSDRSSLWRP